MTCEEKQTDLISLVCGELPPDKKIVLEEHISECSLCDASEQDLTETASILRKWRDEDPNLNLTFLQLPESNFLKIRNIFSGQFTGFRKFGYGFAFAALLFISFAALFNTELTIADGRFSLSMGLSRDKDAEIRNIDYPQGYTASDQEFLLQVNQRILASEEKQRKETAQVLAEILRGLEYRRQNDLQLVSSGLQSIQQGTIVELRRNNKLLVDLIKVSQEGKSN